MEPKLFLLGLYPNNNIDCCQKIFINIGILQAKRVIDRFIMEEVWQTKHHAVVQRNVFMFTTGKKLHIL